MGMRSFIAKLLKEVAEHNLGEIDSEEKADRSLGLMNPELAPSGFIRIKCVVVCPCGESAILDVRPPNVTDNEVERILKEVPGAIKRDVRPEGIENKEEPEVSTCAMNHGHTLESCDGCKRQFIVAWQMESCAISPDVKVPWRDSESPDSSSSGRSGFTIAGNETVH